MDFAVVTSRYFTGCKKPKLHIRTEPEKGEAHIHSQKN